MKYLAHYSLLRLPLFYEFIIGNQMSLDPIFPFAIQAFSQLRLFYNNTFSLNKG